MWHWPYPSHCTIIIRHDSDYLCTCSIVYEMEITSCVQPQRRNNTIMTGSFPTPVFQSIIITITSAKLTACICSKPRDGLIWSLEISLLWLHGFLWEDYPGHLLQLKEQIKVLRGLLLKLWEAFIKIIKKLIKKIGTF